MIKIHRTPITLAVPLPPIKFFGYEEYARQALYKQCCAMIDRDKVPYKLQIVMWERDALVGLLVDI